MEGVQSGMQTGGDGAGSAGRPGFSGSTIKIIAVAAMLIDHAAATVLARYLIGGIREAADTGTTQNWLAENAMWYDIYDVMRGIGRLGFPIFCFLLVEGYQRTRDVKKYALRLGLFALISALPFDLAICGTPFHMGYQNVYFTLLLGLLALWAYGFFGKFGQEGKADLPAPVRIGSMVTGVVAPVLYLGLGMRKQVVTVEFPYKTCLAVAAVIVCGLAGYGIWKGLRSVQTACMDMTALAACMIIAMYLETDYSGMGVLTITAIYLFRRRKALAMLAGCVVLCVMSLSEVYALFAVLPIALYNGQRGMKMKYFFYAFYPVHLLLLYAAAVLLGLGSVILL